MVSRNPKTNLPINQNKISASTAVPTENTKVQPPINQVPTSVSSTGSYQGGQMVPAMGTPEYNQASKNAADTAAAQRAAIVASTQGNTGTTFDPNNFNANIGNLYKANAPIDLNATGINQDLTNLNAINSQIAKTTGNKLMYDANAYGGAVANPTAGDFLGNNLDFNAQRAAAVLGGLGLAQTGITNTLQNQLAVAQAQRTAGVEQAGVPFSAANQPVATQPATTYVNPYNPVSVAAFNAGLPGGGGTGALGSAVSTYADKVKAGQMSYDDAVKALSAYGPRGQQSLTQALGPNFNVAQSNTLAAQQGAIGPSFNFAKTALQNVQNTIKDLGITQNTNIPLVNQASNWASMLTGLGSEKTRAYMQAVQEARNAYQQLLAASKGGTPSDYSGQATAAIPDQPTPNDINAALSTVEGLGGAKVGIYGNPGASTSNTASGQSFTEGQTAAGGELIYKDGKWQVNSK